MTKQEKQSLESSKPIKEQNYWKLSKSDKKSWLEEHNMTFKMDILFPILEFVGLILLLSFCIIGFAIARGGALAIIIFIFIFLLALSVWCIFRMVKGNRGLFIARFWHVEKVHKEQKQQIAKPMLNDSADKSNSKSSTTDDYSELI